MINQTNRQQTAEREMREATKLAHQGKYKCRRCNKIDDQENGVIVAFQGNVLLGLCPGCIVEPVVIKQSDGCIHVTMPRPKDSRVILASDLPNRSQLHLANPKVEEVKL